jgi:hypothetical protein
MPSQTGTDLANSKNHASVAMAQTLLLASFMPAWPNANENDSHYQCAREDDVVV